jgi:hypothetical protein
MALLDGINESFRALLGDMRNQLEYNYKHIAPVLWNIGATMSPNFTDTQNNIIGIMERNALKAAKIPNANIVYLSQMIGVFDNVPFDIYRTFFNAYMSGSSAKKWAVGMCRGGFRLTNITNQDFAKELARACESGHKYSTIPMLVNAFRERLIESYEKLIQNCRLMRCLMSYINANNPDSLHNGADYYFSKEGDVEDQIAYIIMVYVKPEANKIPGADLVQIFQLMKYLENISEDICKVLLCAYMSSNSANKWAHGMHYKGFGLYCADFNEELKNPTKPEGLCVWLIRAIGNPGAYVEF